MGKGKTLSMDLRERIVDERRRSGDTYESIAERFRVGRASVSRVLGLQRSHGSVAPKVPKKRVTKLDEHDRDMLRTGVEVMPDATLPELGDALFNATGKRVSRATIGRELRAMGVTRKKSR